MFRGTGHGRHVQAAGGSSGGATHPDFTVYSQTLPAGALERVLFLEARRMRRPMLARRELGNQIAVIKQEIGRKARCSEATRSWSTACRGWSGP